MKLNPRFFVAAYATSPTTSWDPVIDSAYFASLLQDSRVEGLEHPYLDEDSSRYPMSWLHRILGDSKTLLLTLLPATMRRGAACPGFGIASQDEKLRSEAVRLVERAHDHVRSLNTAFGRPVVKAVHLHTAPRNDGTAQRGSAEALHRSLGEITAMDWQKVALNTEHCDAFVPGQLPEKGYLSLSDEIAVLKEVGHVGLVINWGRSAIEARGSVGAAEHLRRAREARLLRGVFFSGCTDLAGSPYGAWKDTHIPPQGYPGSRYLAEGSLLGGAEIRHAMDEISACTDPVYLGIKVLDPVKPASRARSTGMNLESISAIHRALNPIGAALSAGRRE